jgi:hypothetical protein
MAKATIETGGLDWSDFRALEYFAIIYDIATDEEQYNQKWCELEPQGYKPYDKRKRSDKTNSADKPWATHRYFLFPDSGSPGDLPDDVTITAGFYASGSPYSEFLDPPKELRDGRLPFAALEHESTDPLSILWRKLLLAKYVRAELQKAGSTTAFDALDKLGIALLRAMPLLECEIEWDQLDDLQRQLLILKILFLNEAAACCLDHQSISLSDDCLNLIKKVVGKGKTPYELVALYSKAQGHLHILDYDDALRVFEEVDTETRAARNSYFAPETSDDLHLRWPGQEKLFATYVGYPSVLQYADTLLNLQRSWEAGKRLLEKSSAAPEPATGYQRARRQILRARIANDRSSTDANPDWTEDGVNTDNLTLQRLAADSERALAECRLKTADAVEALRDGEPRDATQAIRASLAEFETATEKLRNRMGLAARNRSEIDKACLSWAEGLSACQDLISFALAEEDVVGNDRDRVLDGVRHYFHLGAGDFVFRNVAVDLCIDPGYRDHAVEVRKTLVESLSGIHGLRHRAVGRERISGFLKLFEEIAEGLSRLLDGLIDRPPRFTSKIEIRGWLEQKTLLAGDLLPGEDFTARHKELRAFIGYGFVHPTEDDVSLDAAQRRAEQKVWKKCKAYKCVVSSKPTKCGGRVLARNPSFTSAESGSKTLHHLDRLVQMNRDTIEERLYQQRKHDAGWHFVVLQRWNSYTPAMRSSEGGGYFLFHAGNKSRSLPGPIDVGVVIDPGYGFVKNFFSEGFGVCDVTAIVITHDHPDHLADVGSLVNLLVEVRKNRGDVSRKSPKVEMLLSRGAFKRLIPQIESARDVFRDTVVLEPGTEYLIEGPSGRTMIGLQACRALHRDSSDLPHREGFDSVGLIAEIVKSPESKVRIGIPSDTKWDAQISGEFTGQASCDLICLHLGSIMPEKFDLISYFDPGKTSSKVLCEKQHLYLPGVVWYLEAIREHRANGMPAMVILSEFGEELAGGVRVDIARRLQAYTDERTKGKGKVVVLPGDVGLRVDPMGHTIRCSCCHLEHPWTTPFHCETSGTSEQIFYVCPRCLRNLTQQERAESFANHHPSLLGTKS